MGYINDKYGESKFECELRNSCAIRGYEYLKIKDPVYKCKRTVGAGGRRNKGGHSVIPQRQDFDGLIYLPKKTWSVECKYNNHAIKEHQMEAHLKLNKINDSHRFLRKIVKEDPKEKGEIVILYRVEKVIDGSKEVIAEFNNSVDQLVKWLEER